MSPGAQHPEAASSRPINQYRDAIEDWLSSVGESVLAPQQIDGLAEHLASLSVPAGGRVGGQLTKEEAEVVRARVEFPDWDLFATASDHELLGAALAKLRAIASGGVEGAKEDDAWAQVDAASPPPAGALDQLAGPREGELVAALRNLVDELDDHDILSLAAERALRRARAALAGSPGEERKSDV